MLFQEYNSNFLWSLRKIKSVSSYHHSLTICTRVKSINMYDPPMCASGCGNRRENAVGDIWRRLKDGVQETVHCYWKQVRRNLYHTSLFSCWDDEFINSKVLPFPVWRPKPMIYKGKDVRNVFHLRTPEDANSIAKLANNKNAVIVGTSFVGEKMMLNMCSFISAVM